MAEHLIHRLLIELSGVSNEKEYNTKANAIFSIINTSLKVRLENLLDRYNFKDYHIVINSIEIDVGEFRQHYFESDVLIKIENYLEKKLRTIYSIVETAIKEDAFKNRSSDFVELRGLESISILRKDTSKSEAKQNYLESEYVSGILNSENRYFEAVTFYLTNGWLPSFLAIPQNEFFEQFLSIVTNKNEELRSYIDRQDIGTKRKIQRRLSNFVFNTNTTKAIPGLQQLNSSQRNSFLDKLRQVRPYSSFSESESERESDSRDTQHSRDSESRDPQHSRDSPYPHPRESDSIDSDSIDSDSRDSDSRDSNSKYNQVDSKHSVSQSGKNSEQSKNEDSQDSSNNANSTPNSTTSDSKNGNMEDNIDQLDVDALNKMINDRIQKTLNPNQNPPNLRSSEVDYIAINSDYTALHIELDDLQIDSILKEQLLGGIEIPNNVRQKSDNLGLLIRAFLEYLEFGEIKINVLPYYVSNIAEVINQLYARAPMVLAEILHKSDIVNKSDSVIQKRVISLFSELSKKHIEFIFQSTISNSSKWKKSLNAVNTIFNAPSPFIPQWLAQIKDNSKAHAYLLFNVLKSKYFDNEKLLDIASEISLSESILSIYSQEIRNNSELLLEYFSNDKVVKSPSKEIIIAFEKIVRSDFSNLQTLIALSKELGFQKKNIQSKLQILFAKANSSILTYLLREFQFTADENLERDVIKEFYNNEEILQSFSEVLISGDIRSYQSLIKKLNSEVTHNKGEELSLLSQIIPDTNNKALSSISNFETFLKDAERENRSFDDYLIPILNYEPSKENIKLYESIILQMHEWVIKNSGHIEMHHTIFNHLTQKSYLTSAEKILLRTVEKNREIIRIKKIKELIKSGDIQAISEYSQELNTWTEKYGDSVRSVIDLQELFSNKRTYSDAEKLLLNYLIHLNEENNQVGGVETFETAVEKVVTNFKKYYIPRIGDKSLSLDEIVKFIPTTRDLAKIKNLTKELNQDHILNNPSLQHLSKKTFEKILHLLLLTDTARTLIKWRDRYLKMFKHLVSEDEVNVIFISFTTIKSKLSEDNIMTYFFDTAKLLKGWSAEKLKGKASEVYQKYKEDFNDVQEVTIKKYLRSLPSMAQAQSLNSLGSLKDGILVKNAGLVIIWPFMKILFKLTGLMDDGGNFVDREAKERAIFLLQYVVVKQSEGEEPYLILNKIFVGIDLDEPITTGITLTDKEKDICDALLLNVIKQWPAMSNSTPDNLRGTFLIRDGMLYFQENNWHLVVEKKTFDLLLGKIPWSYSMIKATWLDYMITVDWE